MANDAYQPKLFDALTVGIWRENPTFRLLIGMCPPLAITTAVKPALIMGLSVIFVLICSNFIISLMRNLLKPHLRIMMFTLTIATFVTICDLFLRAFVPDTSKTLGPYVPLIIVNCIIIFRAEACASKAGPLVSVLDAIGTGTGFTIALCILASIREILATGNIVGYRVMPQAFVPWLAMQMPVGAFVTLGLLLGLAAVLTGKSTRLGEGDTQAKQETDSQNPSLSGEELNSPSRSRKGAA